MKRKSFAILAAIFMFFVMSRAANAGIPLLNIEGEGGGGIVPWAYLINAPKDGAIGKPSLGAWTWISNGYTINFWTLGWSPMDRLELGFAWQNLDITTLRDDLKGDSQIALGAGTALNTGEDNLQMITAHAKFLVLKESASLPAIAVSVEYKQALSIDELDENLTRGARSVLGATKPKVLTWMGVDDDKGFDINLMATKLWNPGIPVLTAVNLRYTQANQLGFLGFSDNWSLQPEVTLAILPEANVAVGIEYRRKPDELKSLNDYLKANGGAASGYRALDDYTFKENDFVDFFVAYLPTPKLSITAAVANIGNVVHKETNAIWAFNIKYDF
ncbi:MAG: DUF3034 family protein [Deltaproteobacteria bacterium]|nr:DUF3034 family protein [Deltaproteobacteria bacterium]